MGDIVGERVFKAQFSAPVFKNKSKFLETFFTPVNFNATQQIVFIAVVLSKEI